MTREKEINDAVSAYVNSTEPLLVNCGEHSFRKGIEWADNNPKSPWISVNDDLPCNHEELVHDSWYTEQVFVRIVAKNGVILYTTNAMINVQLDKKWKWTCGEEYEVTHWMPSPKYE